MVLWFLAEGVDVSVMVRFTGHGDATIARWLERMGRHSQTWHHRLFRDLVFTILQLDELYTRVYTSGTSTPGLIDLNLSTPTGRIIRFDPLCLPAAAISSVDGEELLHEMA
jgi:hypothetical protein